MAITIEATYENGVLKPARPLPVAEHEKVQITVHVGSEVKPAIEAVQRSYGLIGWTDDHETLERILAEAAEPEELP